MYDEINSMFYSANTLNVYCLPGPELGPEYWAPNKTKSLHPWSLLSAGVEIISLLSIYVCVYKLSKVL